MHELAPIVAALNAHQPRRLRLRRRFQRAAVAVIVRESRQGAEVLLVERAHHPGDPWSGDMALPGGRIDALDEASASTAACRETGEETGLTITRANGIGRLSDRMTLNHRRRAPMIVSPFVYQLADNPQIRLNHEIAGTRWLALAWLDEPTHRVTLRWRIGPVTLPMPCYHCDARQRLWGLTLSILDEFMRVARRNARHESSD